MKTTTIQPIKSARSAPLVLPAAQLRNNAQALFAQLDKDPAARAEFIRNPTGVLTAKVSQRQLPAQQVSDVNRLLFSMLANDGFRQWMDDYPASPAGKPVSEEQFSKDFAAAVLKYADADLIRAMFKLASDGFGLPGFGNSAEQLLIGPEKSVATPPATPSTSDQTLRSSQNFNGFASGLPFGFGGVADAALLRTVIGQLVDQAKQMQAAGQLKV
ncbi:hypothetical protein VA599_06445 [Chromobacterium sp. TRC.1.1.SA]|uniref:Uncharacterized protein n=1 Tax=Chromobacterium indicum TaxID=3110228 RepID=A0ABV0CK45_9NEIS|nr:hypothetical protein [Chromobacterium vaccinii]AVG14877.1 hypothetical protein CFN79_02810 [Chromobacterium vaccinii]